MEAIENTVRNFVTEHKHWHTIKQWKQIYDDDCFYLIDIINANSVNIAIIQLKENFARQEESVYKNNTAHIENTISRKTALLILDIKNDKDVKNCRKVMYCGDILHLISPDYIETILERTEMLLFHDFNSFIDFNAADIKNAIFLTKQKYESEIYFSEIGI